MTTPIYTATRQRLVDRLVTRRGMHPTTARNVVDHVIEHGRNSPWAREVNATAIGLSFELCTEYARALARAAQPAFQQLAQAVRAAQNAIPEDFALAPPPAAPRDRPAWQSPYGPAPRKARR